MTWPRNTDIAGDVATPASPPARSALVLRLDPGLRRRLENIATEEQKSLSSVVRELLAPALERRDAGHLTTSADAAPVVEKIDGLRAELAWLETLLRAQARAVFGIEELLAHWAANGAYDAWEDGLLAELRQIGEEALRRTMPGAPAAPSALTTPSGDGAP